MQVRLKTRGFNPWVGKIPWRRPIPVFLPGEPHGQRSLAGCGPWDHDFSWTRLKHSMALCLNPGVYTHTQDFQYLWLHIFRMQKASQIIWYLQVSRFAQGKNKSLLIIIIGLHWWLSSKESACNAGDMSSITGSAESLEKEMATHSSILAWRIPWTEESDGLWSMGPWLQLDMTEAQYGTVPAAAKSLQSCLTLCDAIDSSPPGFPVPGILYFIYIHNIFSIYDCIYLECKRHLKSSDIFKSLDLLKIKINHY